MAHDQTKRLNTKASVAGGGGGTFLLALAERLPPDYALIKSILIYSSPAIAVGVAALWVLIAGYIRKRKRRYDMTSIIKEARDRWQAVCDDAHSSESLKKTVRKQLEDFEVLAMELLKDEADIVRAQLRVIR